MPKGMNRTAQLLAQHGWCATKQAAKLLGLITYNTEAVVKLLTKANVPMVSVSKLNSQRQAYMWYAQAIKRCKGLAPKTTRQVTALQRRNQELEAKLLEAEAKLDMLEAELDPKRG